MDVTNDRLLGGKVLYTQPRHGFRSSLEPVLLAASIPARTGQSVLEGGTGPGASLLCLAERVPGISGLGVERDPAIAALASRNAHLNHRSDLLFVAAITEALPTIALFDHAFANPPYHAEVSTASAIPQRDMAKRAHSRLLRNWVLALASRVIRKGTVTFIVPASMLEHCLTAFTEAGCGSTALFPLWPRSGVPAKLLLLRAIKGGRGSCRLLPGLVLHEINGEFTAAAQPLLRDAAALAWDSA